MRGARFPIAAILVSGAVATASFLISLPPQNERGAADPASDISYVPGIGLTPPSITETESVTVGASASAAIVPNAASAPIDREPPPPYQRTMTIGKGDTLMAMLTDAGISNGEAHEAITALSKIYSPRRILPGQEVTLTFNPDPEGKEEDRFVGLTLATAVDREVRVDETDKGAFKATEIEKPLVRSVHRNQGDIQASLYMAAMRAELPEAVLMELIRAYSWDVDFQRDIQPGDAFEVMYERLDTEEGELARYGNVLYAALTLSGKFYPIYLHTTKDGTTDYFDDKGRSAKKALMRTPINGAKLSSRYGNRRHPILGYDKMHRGVDFAAPPGTPILAAGDGVIDHAGTNGAYGKYVRIRHNAEYSTAYAHMKGYARGVNRGTRVRQGQVIGYVGSTGRSTGPHLHYEILHNGRQTNPLNVKMPSGIQLNGTELARFEDTRRAMEQQFAAQESGLAMAETEAQR